jgi:hypothetical protein
VITDTFHQGFTNAMRVTLILPIAVLTVAALACLLIKRRKRAVPPDAARAPHEEAAAPA